MTELRLVEAERDRLYEELRQVQERLSSDLDAMTRLHHLGSLFVREGNLEQVLVEIVDAAIAMSGADFGNIQLLDAKSSDLKIVAHRGFQDWWLQFWNQVSRGQGVCGTALERGERVIVEDVEHSPIFAGTPALEIQRKAGVRAVQSTPLVSRSGKPLGMFSTHWRRPGRPNERCLRLLDLLARHAADIVERAQSEEARKRTEEAERRRSALLRMLANSIPDPVFVKDEQSRMVFANPATLESIGKPAEDVLGRSDREFFDDAEAGAKIVENDQRIMAAGEATTLEERIEAPTGPRWFLSTKAPFRDAAGKVVGIIGVTREITARKRAEAALRESEERFRAYVTASSDVVYRMSPDWSEMRELRGREFVADTDAPSRGWLEKYIYPEDQPHVLAVIHEAIRTRSVFQSEHRVLRVDGSLGWTFSRAIPILDEDGAIVEWFGAAADITARKRAEEALRESEERLRLAQQVARVGAFEWDLGTGVNTWTPELEDMYGLPRGHFPRTEAAWESLIHPDDRAEAVRKVEQALEGEATGDVEWRVVWPDGSVHWIAGRFRAVRDSSGKAQRLTGMNIDITERKRAELALRESEERLRASEAALREADRNKDQFLAMLSHELRNPLTPIRNSLYILERAAPGDPQARRAQETIRRQIGHLTWLVDDLLDVTRIAHGKIQLQRERLDLNQLAHRVVEDHRAIFAKGDVRLEVLPSPAEVWVDGDRVRLAQVLSNLLQNAAKFTPHGGKATVSVESSRSRRQAVLTVRDTGRGIQPEMMPRLFQAFSQVDSTIDRSKGGLGLGLALVKGLVGMHGGSVTASSDGAGRGAVFTITLPLDIAAARPVPAASAVEGARSAPRRVLVIEDNEDTANTLREVLEFDAHVVEVAYTGAEGFVKARAFHPDVVLCDISLPDMDGYEVARAMRAAPEIAGVGLVALSGFAQPEDVAIAREAGFDEHLAKPPSIEALARAVAEFGKRAPESARLTVARRD